MTSVWILVDGIQEEGPEFMTLKQVPMIGCYGLNQGPELVQFTSAYEVTSSVGCGSVSKFKDNINALSCATTTESVENDALYGFKKITLDISKCKYKDNARFITLIRTAAARNFPQYNKNFKVIKGKEVELVLIK